MTHLTMDEDISKLVSAMKEKGMYSIPFEKFKQLMEMRDRKMLKEVCECDISGECPYGATSYSHCEWYCGEPDDYNEIDEYDEDYTIPDEWLYTGERE